MASFCAARCLSTLSVIGAVVGSVSAGKVIVSPFVVPMWHRRNEPLSSWRASVPTRNVGVAEALFQRDLPLAAAVGVGMFLQTFLLALTERGLGSCVEVSVTGYPEIIRAQLSIPAELSILCGAAALQAKCERHGEAAGVRCR